MNGRSTSGTTGLGSVEVRGRSRVPSPPTRITACTGSTPPDALVGKASRADRLRVQRVAAVDKQVAAHAASHLGPIELSQLLPLGDQHDGVGLVHGGERR